MLLYRRILLIFLKIVPIHCIPVNNHFNKLQGRPQIRCHGPHRLPHQREAVRLSHGHQHSCLQVAQVRAVNV